MVEESAREEKTKESEAKAAGEKRRINPWMVSSIVLLIVLVGASAYWVFFSSNPQNLPLAILPGTDTGTKKVIIEEFSDFQCPYCAKAVDTIKQIKQAYGDGVEVQFNQFPLSFHANAKKAAEASECARDQGKFWEYHDKLFANQSSLAVENLKQYAVDLGLDAEKFNSCLDSGEKAQKVEDDIAKGTAKGVTGTPAFFINGRLISGAQPFDAFKKIIDEEIGKPAEQPTEEPQVNFTVLNDSTCKTCTYAQLVDAIKSRFFPNLQVNEIDISSEEGKKMVQEFGVNVVPAYFFGEEVADTSSYADISQTLEQKGSYYMIIPAAVDVGKVLEMPNLADRPVEGQQTAKITIVLFSDFQCPYCEKFYSESMQEIEANYVDTGKAKIVFMEFPLSFHPNAQKAAEAAECAFDQGKFWEYHDLLFNDQNKLSVDDLKQRAFDLGLNTTKFNSCLDSGEKQAVVEQTMQQGAELGVNGTPAVYIDGIAVIGAQPFENFKQVIEEELAK